MNRQYDLERFAKALTITNEVLGGDLSPAKMEGYYQALFRTCRSRVYSTASQRRVGAYDSSRGRRRSGSLRSAPTRTAPPLPGRRQ
jgi:hypothetical protein